MSNAPQKKVVTNNSSLKLKVNYIFNVLNATPKDGVNYLKETRDNRIMKNHTPWGKGCTSDVEVAHDCNTMCDATDDIKQMNSKKEVAADIASLCLACHKERSS